VAALSKRHSKTLNVTISDKTSGAEIELIRKLASFSDVIVVNAFIRVAAYKGSVDLSEGELTLLKQLSAMDKPFAFVAYGSPYVISFAPDLPSYVLAYEHYPAAEEAAVKCVLGEMPFRGKLPVELPGFCKIGHSVSR
jgi:hypothetical protein